MLSHAFVSATLLAAITLSTAPALAAGEILITQAKAVAGNVTPGDAAGFPVTLSLPGTYEFATNIYPTANQVGIHVTQRNVTIDLNGFELHGANTAAHGITGNQAGTTIRNGTITGFKFYGIYTLGANWSVDNIKAIKNARTGIYLNGLYASVRSSTATENGEDGIFCWFYCHVENSTSADNEGDGVEIGSGSVLGSNLRANTGFGVNAPYSIVGSAHNFLISNFNAGAQVSGSVVPLNPNHCTPACP